MASSSYRCVVLSLVVLLPLLLVSVSASTYIDTICQRVSDKASCAETLNAYPPAASAASLFQAAEATLNLAMSHADKSADFAGTAANKNPSLVQQFKAAKDAFINISNSLKSASKELQESPETANYDVMQCTDSTTVVKNLVGQNTDNDSKTIITMTLMMEKLLAIAVGATEAVGG